MHRFTWLSCLAIASATAALVTSQSTSAAAATTAGIGKPISHFAMYVHDVDASQVPREMFVPQMGRPHQLRNHTGLSSKKYAQLKKLARSSRLIFPHERPVAPPLRFGNPGITTVFSGLADSASTCPYFGGCAPSDGAVAASPTFEIEGVNTSYAVYDPNGNIQAGWPKNSTTFFGIPAPGACDPNGAFTSDPRAFYDPNDKRFFVEILEVEGLTNSCPQASRFWIAVSATSDPRGSWHVYAFDMDLSSGNWADYSQLGFNASAVCFTGNMFSFSSGTFQYAENFCATKKNMEKGKAVSYFGFFGPSIGGAAVDTLQPVETEASASADPGVEYFVASENINFGGGLCSSGCNTDFVEAMTAPGTSGFGGTVALVTTAGYALPPSADEPGCGGCIDTDDVRVGGTPVYRNGHIIYAHNTGLNNGTTTVSAVVYDDVLPTLDQTSFGINGITLEQSSYIFFGGGDLSAYYPVVNTDSSGDISYSYGASDGSSFFPSGFLSTHKVTEVPNELDCFCAIFTDQGVNDTFDFRWGDYNSSSWTGNAKSETTWLEMQDGSPSGDWETKLIKQTTF